MKARRGSRGIHLNYIQNLTSYLTENKAPLHKK